MDCFQLEEENTVLQTNVKELHVGLATAEDKIVALTVEKDHRIEVLENELKKLQANEGTLNDTIEELREVENALRQQVSDRQQYIL